MPRGGVYKASIPPSIVHIMHWHQLIRLSAYFITFLLFTHPFQISGTNSQGNSYNTPGGSNSSGGSSYHYSNTNGGYYYANDNGSTYYSSPSGTSTYTSPSGSTSTSSKKWKCSVLDLSLDLYSCYSRRLLCILLYSFRIGKRIAVIMDSMRSMDKKCCVRF